MKAKNCKYKGGVYCLNYNNEEDYCKFTKQENKCPYAEQEKE